MKREYVFGILAFAMLVSLIMPVDAAFSSTYVPSHYFDKIRIEGKLPQGEISWDDIHLDTAKLIITNESVWYKQYDNLDDLIGITFISYSTNSQAISDEINEELKSRGVVNITTTKYEVPTIELYPDKDLEFFVHLQNTGTEPVEYQVKIVKGEEYVTNVIKESYTVPPGTISDQFPVEILLRAPSKMLVGTLSDFEYSVSSIEPIATDGSLKPTIPFMKKYKVFLVEPNQTEQIEVIIPTPTKKSNFFDENKYVIIAFIIIVVLIYLFSRRRR